MNLNSPISVLQGGSASVASTNFYATFASNCYTLAAGQDGQIKELALMDEASYPIVVQTTHGSFPMGPISNGLKNAVKLVFVGALSRWVSLTSGLTWFPSTTQYAVVNPDPTLAYTTRAVAVSSDGLTIAVGNPRMTNGGIANSGAVTVLTFINGVWSNQTQLTCSSSTNGMNMGYTMGSIKLSGDGNTLVVGGFSDGTQSQGTVCVFGRSSGVWGLSGRYSGTVANGRCGTSVACNSDCSVFAYSCPGITPMSTGNVYVMSRTAPGSPYSGPVTIVLSTAGAASGTHTPGVGLAMSADGSTLLVGDPGDGVSTANTGVFYTCLATAGVFPGSCTARTIPPENSGPGKQGTALAIDNRGATAVSCGPADTSNKGSCIVYTSPPGTGTWTAVTTATGPLVGGASTGTYGSSVAINADGTVIVVGDPADAIGGAIRWYTTNTIGVSGTNWALLSKVTQSPSTTSFGFDVDIDGLGVTTVGTAAVSSADGSVGIFS